MRIGVDLGGTKIEAVALDEQGTMLTRQRVPTPREDYDATVGAIAGLAAAIEKETGEDPFNTPQIVLDAVQKGQFGRYAVEDLGGVPIDFLTNVDTTGGNSGSPTMNARGEFVGLLFDGTWESIIADWDFIPSSTRSIHCDVRYTLWLMDHIDGADHLMVEMGLTPEANSPTRP